MSSELSLTSTVILHAEPAHLERPHETVAPKEAPPDKDRAIESSRKAFVEELARENGLAQGRLVIEKDDDSGRFVHKLIDPNNGEVVRQWPEESWLEFAKAHHAPSGLWVNQRA